MAFSASLYGSQVADRVREIKRVCEAKKGGTLVAEGAGEAGAEPSFDWEPVVLPGPSVLCLDSPFSLVQC